MPRSYWGQYAYYNMQLSYSNNPPSGGLGISENSFYSSGQIGSSRYYELNISGDYVSAPYIYMSMYAP